MDKHDDGGPAFPVEDLGSTGMSLRDWFAGLAMQSILANPSGSNQDGKPIDNQILLASASYKVADAMLTQRSKP